MKIAPLRPFDMLRFHAELDAARQARGFTWAGLAADINIAFDGTPSIPINPSTLRTMPHKNSVTSAVVLQTLRWLRRAPEEFLAGTGEPVAADTKLPEPGAGRVLRLDTVALHAALDAERVRRGLTWKQVSAELPNFTPGMLTNLAGGPLIGFPRVMFLSQWLGVPLARFVRDRSR